MVSKRNKSAGNGKTTPGVIRDGETYTLAELESRSGLGRFALRQLRIKGLIVRRISGRAFVRGEDFNRFLVEVTTDRSECASQGATASQGAGAV